MSNIYEISTNLMQIMDMMDDPELDPQTLGDTFEAIEGEFEEKADAYARIMKNLEGDVAALKNEIQRLSDKKATIENNIKRMKQALQIAMEMTGKVKFKTDLFSFGIQKNTSSVVIDTDINNLDPKFLKFREPEVNKTAIKEAIQNGEDLTGYAHLEQSQSLRIR